MSTQKPVRPRLLMSKPEHFSVDYIINPWMDPQRWAKSSRSLYASAQKEWNKLFEALLSCGAVIDLVKPVPGLPDFVFTANAAVVLDGIALLARFRNPERRREEFHYRDAFEGLASRGLITKIMELPANLVLEGAGDCAWDRTRQLFWMGYGPRSSAQSAPVVADVLGAEVVPLELRNDRFYHLDTALCVLGGGEIMYVPQAFSPRARACIRDRADSTLRIEIDAEDSLCLAANAVCLDRTIILSRIGSRLRADLQERGYRVVETPLQTFWKGGGSAMCLTLRLDHESNAVGARRKSCREIAASR